MSALKSLIYFLAVAAPRLGMFVAVFVLARLLSLEEMGHFVLVVAMGELMEMAAVGWVRLFTQNREAGRHVISPLRMGRLVALCAGMTALALALVAPLGWLVADERWPAFSLAVAAYVLAFGLLRYGLGVLQALKQHQLFARVEMARSVGILAAIGLIWALEPHDFVTPSLILSGATGLVALYGAWLTRPHVSRPRFAPQGYRAAAAFGLPIIADTLLAYVLISFDRFVLNEIAGAASVAIYGVAYALGRQPIDFVAGPLNNLSLPVLLAARNTPEKAQEIQTGISISLFVLCAGTVAGVFLLRAPLVHLILKEQYWADAVWLMPAVTAASCLLVFKMYLYDNLYFMAGRTGLKLAAMAPAALVSAVLTVSLIWWKGLAGAAAAYAVGAAVGLIASIVATRTFCPFPAPLGWFARIAALAAVAGVALEGGLMLGQPLGPVAEIALGALAFCVVYGAGLTLAGVSLKKLLTSPWAPLAAR